MVKYSVNVNAVTRASLGLIRSNFLELAFERFLYLKDRLRVEKNAQIRLLILKEVFSIFDEISSIQDIRRNFNDPDGLNTIFRLIAFVRNVLLHFPLFGTWDQVFISPAIGREMMKKRKGGIIASYLNDNLGQLDQPFDVNFSGGIVSSSINLSAIKPESELTYLKDIISEHDVITLLIDIVQYLYTASKEID